jgi:arylsulfatase A
MLEGGSLVPLIARWPGRTPAGKVSADLIDSTDILPTLAEIASAEIAGAEIAGAKLPARSTLDGRSFAPQLLGQKGNPRDWIYIQLANQWYVREAGWKLNREGQLFNMKDAPFEEPLVPADTANPEAKAARSRLQAALALLNPEAGIADEGDGTGRHANREANRKKKKKN